MKTRIELLCNGTMIHATWRGGCGVIDVGNFQVFRNISFEIENGPCHCDRYGWVPPCGESAKDQLGIRSRCRLSAGHVGEHLPSIGDD